MAYTKEKLIEQVFLAVTGGKPNRDVDVERVDVSPYVSAAIRWFHRKHYYEYKAMEFVHGMDQSSLSTYIVPVEDGDRGFKQAALPVRPLIIPGGSAIDSVMPKEGFTAFVRVRGQQWLSGLQRLGDTTFWWDEGSKILIHNSGKVCELVVRMIPDPDTLGDKDEVILPAGGEVEVIDMAVQFFTGQRTMPSDLAVNSVDDVGVRARNSG